MNRFHHIEFYCADATTSYKRFLYGLGMNLVAKSDLTTGNKTYASYAVQSNELIFVFTSSYNNQLNTEELKMPHPGFKAEVANKFVLDHGLAVRAVTINVEDATKAYDISVKNGATGVLTPTQLVDTETNKNSVISEIKLFGDVVIRFKSGDYDGPVLPNYQTIPITAENNTSCGLVRADHIVSNVPHLFNAVDYLMGALGLHEFSEFTAEDVGTVDSGLNSMVLANNNEFVLLPVNEPIFGTRRKSQIQNYLEHNNGSGVQHIALKTDDIFQTMRELRARSASGAGLEFMPRPSQSYYDKVPERLAKGGKIEDFSPEQMKELQELGLLIDRDDQGILVQIFTTPVGDRPTIFFEIIQRIGCHKTADKDKDKAAGVQEVQCKVRTTIDQQQSAGCGGFGKGNFSELFKSIENFEKAQETV